jgi:hypothetical protein
METVSVAITTAIAEGFTTACLPIEIPSWNTGSARSRLNLQSANIFQVKNKDLFYLKKNLT